MVMIGTKLLVVAALLPLVQASTGQCWSAAGIATMTTMGKIGMFGNPSVGDAVGVEIKTTLDGMGKWDMVKGMAMEDCAAAANAKCSSLSPACGDTKVNLADKDCLGAEASTCDEATCCQAKATCDSLTCPSTAPNNKGSDTTCPSADASSCTAETCCEDQPTCGGYTCGTSETNAGKAAVKCGGPLPACSGELCCEAQGMCSGFTCEAPKRVNTMKTCSGNQGSCDMDLCCEAPATCDQYAKCTDAMKPLKKGNDAECSSTLATCDDATCCQACGDIKNETICLATTPVAMRRLTVAHRRLSTGQCWSAAGIATMTTMGKIGMFGNPSAGDAVGVEIKTTLDGMGKWETVKGMAMEDCAETNNSPVSPSSTAQGDGVAAKRSSDLACYFNTTCKARFHCGHMETMCSGDKPLNTGKLCEGDNATCNRATCCEAKGTCDTWSCPDTHVNKGISVLCEKATCMPSDQPMCCEAKAKCESHTCPDTHVNKGSGLCAGTQCEAGDNAGCCEAKAKCESHTCPDTHVNKGSNSTLCAGTQCGVGDNAGCCDAKAECESHTCPASHVNKGSGLCAGKTCMESDQSMCCEATTTTTTTAAAGAPPPPPPQAKTVKGAVKMEVTLPTNVTAEAFVNDTSVQTGFRNGIAESLGLKGDHVNWVTVMLSVDTSTGRRLGGHATEAKIKVDYTILVPAAQVAAKAASLQSNIVAASGTSPEAVAARQAMTTSLSNAVAEETKDSGNTYSVTVTSVDQPVVAVVTAPPTEQVSGCSSLAGLLAMMTALLHLALKFE